MDYNYMTKEGLEKLMEEITRLETEERPKIAQMIAEARDKGDLSENAGMMQHAKLCPCWKHKYLSSRQRLPKHAS